jgi:hypothetical protein
MNAFDLKATLLTKHAEHLVINPNTHGVKHESNAWLTNSKLLASRVCARGGHQRFASHLLFSDNNMEYLTRFYSQEKCTPEYWRSLETTN